MSTRFRPPHNPDGTNYKDTVDPRVLEQMEIMPSEVPGYSIPADRRQRLEEITDLRQQEVIKATTAAELEHISKLLDR
jgi:hypothetical protein